ncbi:MAG: hypothetical protein WBO04_12460 [Steroidobacteraceae bacterium]
MCHIVLQDPAFFHFLLRIDEELASATRLEGCPGCGGPLHVADYPRKPRGCPVAVREAYSRRLSFTCGRCNARATPPSVRFAGRRVYLAVVLMLVSPPGRAAGRGLCALLRIPARTLQRWRVWWREDFPSTPFWQSVRERFMPPVRTAQLPQGLLARFEAGALADRLVQALRFIAPLSTATAIR